MRKISILAVLILWPSVVFSGNTNICDGNVVLGECPSVATYFMVCENGKRIDTRKEYCPWKGEIENPQPDSHVSGVSVISGWLCRRSSRIMVQFNRSWKHRYWFSGGTARKDTKEVCGWTDNGFGLLFNWNILGDGEHTMRVKVDGRYWLNADGTVKEIPFTIVTLGEEFAEDLSGECQAKDFPDVGVTTKLEWSESLQNFVIVDLNAEEGLVDED